MPRVTPDDPIAFIRGNLPILPVPGVPEIRLHKALPTSGVGRLVDPNEGGSPYWAYYWGGGLALARYLLDHPYAVTGRRVLDLGAGSGLVAIAAAKSGALSVLAVDVDPLAVQAIGLNAAVNRVVVDVLHDDIIGAAPPDVDVVLVGDLFYEADLAMAVTDFLDRCIESGATVLVGDPWRASLPRHRLRTLAEYQVRETDGAAIGTAVFAFEPFAVAPTVAAPNVVRT